MLEKHIDDFMTYLPESKGFDSIMVVIDKVNKIVVTISIVIHKVSCTNTQPPSHKPKENPYKIETSMHMHTINEEANLK